MKPSRPCFVPLFMAVGSIGIPPFFMSLAEGIESRNVRRIIAQSVMINRRGLFTIPGGGIAG
jgi:small neutral amino acid transporter SnatA (MarC family)